MENQQQDQSGIVAASNQESGQMTLELQQLRELRELILRQKSSEMSARTAPVGPEAVDFEKLIWMDTREAARYLRKTANAIRIMSFRGMLRPRRLGRKLYFRRLELDRLLESSCV